MAIPDLTNPEVRQMFYDAVRVAMRGYEWRWTPKPGGWKVERVLVPVLWPIHEKLFELQPSSHYAAFAIPIRRATPPSAPTGGE